MAKQPKKNPVGRPPVITNLEDAKTSMTASVKIWQLKGIKKKYGSLTKAVEQEIVPKLPKPQQPPKL